MSIFTTLKQLIVDANQVNSRDLDLLRRTASKWYLGYLWVMALVVTGLSAGWSDHWQVILALNIGFAAAATFAHWKSPDAVQTRVTIGCAMLANWMNLIYAGSHYGAGEFILDAHMVYFVLNSILLAFFCWRTLLVINGITVVHHFGLNGLAPLLIWPSAEFSWMHLATHCAMATLVTCSGLAVSITVCRLFGKSEQMLEKLRGEMVTRERLEQEEARLREEALRREEEERLAEQERQQAEARAKAKAEEEARAAEAEKLRLREAAREKEEAARRAQSYEQNKIVEALAKGLKKLSKGDLQVSLDEKFPEAYETLRMDFNVTVSSLSDLIRQIAESVATIDGSSRELASASGELSSRTESSAATLQETSAALNELSTCVSAAAVGSRRANDVSKSAKVKANESTDVVAEATNAMAEIEGSSQQIAKIIDVIDDIAFQTNLLALNAGVEAARAGEAGRGFAVVASEVRALALRSSEAAQEIGTLISNSNNQVVKGVRLVETAGTALSEIISAVTEIARDVGEIASSSDEQASGVQEVNTAVSALDRTMQQNAAMTEQTTAAVHLLMQEASKLHSYIDKFSFDTKAEGAQASTQAA